MRTWWLVTILCICFAGFPATGAFAQTSGSPGGLVVFETFNSTSATNATQATVLAGVMSNDTVLFANASLQLSQDLGFAIVNPNTVIAHATLTLRNSVDGSTASVITIALNPHQQVSEFLSQVFASLPTLSVGFVGSLSVTTDVPVAITALRFRGTNFSTIPITNLSPTSILLPQLATGIGGPTAVILPQFATGGNNWSSNLVISNTSPLPVTVRIDLFKQDGTPLSTVYNSQRGSSFQNIVVPASGIVTYNNNDPNNTNDPLQVGYVIVTPLDVVPPTVISVFPANGTNGAATNTPVTATFSKAMIASTINSGTFTLQGGTTSIQGLITLSGNTATLSPALALQPATTYTATITTGVQDSIAGIPLASNFVWSFTTAGVVTTGGGTTPPPVGNLTGPTVTNEVPAFGATGVSQNPTIAATFSESTMNPATIGSSSFTLTGPAPGNTPITGAVAYSVVNNIAVATFTPNTILTLGLTYTAALTNAVQDLAGNALQPFSWTFTVVTPAAAGPPPVALGAAGPYGILAYSAITLTPSSTINGSVGITNGTATGLTGCTAGCVITGTQDFSNAATAAAKTALVSAYTAAVNSAVPTCAYGPATSVYPAGCTFSAGFDLGGLTLPPGLYTSGSTLQVGTGETLTLNGGPNDTWVFQVGSGLTIGSTAQIVLAGNAKAANIFWQVGTSAVLTGTNTFYGNILANISITLGNSSTVNGRLLAGESGAGAVTLGTATTVTVPSP